MAFVGRLSDMAHIFTKMPSIYAYLTNASTEGSAEYDRILQGGERDISLDAGAFAIEQSYCLKPLANAFYESHKAYVDMQFIIKGAELCALAPSKECSIHTPYNATKDLIIYNPPTHSSMLHLNAGMLAVFFPYDVHASGLGAETLGAQTLYKSVVKVPITLFSMSI